MSETLEERMRNADPDRSAIVCPGDVVDIMNERNQAIEKYKALEAENASLRKDLESETMWAKHYADRAQAFRDTIFPMLEYRKRNALNFQLEKLDDYLRLLEQLMEQQP